MISIGPFLCRNESSAALPLLAHHSIPSHYFMDQGVHLEGEIKDFAYQNPHSMLRVEAKDPRTGEMVDWIVEWGPVRRLKDRGVTKDSVKPGDHVVIDGYPSRDNLDHQIFLRGISRPSDGWKSGRDIR